MPKFTVAPPLPRLIYSRQQGGASIGQCDACPPTERIRMRTSAEIYQPAPILSRQALDDSNWIVLGAMPVVINRAGLDWLENSAPSRPIASDFFTGLVETGLLVPENSPFPPREIIDTLSIWLHLTDRCNLRCAYCYLPHLPADMTLGTGRAAIDAAFRSAIAHGFRALKFKYAGGEPLLCFPLILQLNEYAQALGASHGFAVDGVVLSNGTLLDEAKARSLKENNIRLTLSLDGLEDCHNTQRPYTNGRGSFKDVVRAVDIACALNLTPDISITVSGRNAAGLSDLMKWILERDLSFSINFYRENDYSTQDKSLCLEDEMIIAGMRAAFGVIAANLPARPFLPALLDRTNLSIPHLRTCGVGKNYIVFDPQGRVAACQMIIQQTVGSILSPDPLTALNTDPSTIQNLPVEVKEPCNTCQWRFWCAGGCPLEAFRASGNYDGRSPNCNIYQSLFPEALRLEGMRLLKYAGDQTALIVE